MEPFETFEHAGFVCELHQDEEPGSPADWDQLGELVAFDPLWREYRFAERNSTQEEDDALERGGLRLLARYLQMTQGAVIVPFTFHDYGSGGQRLTAGTLDDDRAAGFIVTTPARCEQIGCDDPEAGLRAELDEWAAYVAGEVVGFVVRENVEALNGRTSGRSSPLAGASTRTTGTGRTVTASTGSTTSGRRRVRPPRRNATSGSPRRNGGNLVGRSRGCTRVG